MKFLLVVLFGVVAIAAGQPVDEAAAPAAVPAEEASVIAIEASPDMKETMEASGSSLKVIEHKLEHWLKKCYKKGGCGSAGYGYGGQQGVRPVPVPVYTPVPVYAPTPYLGSYGGYGASYGGGYGSGYGTPYGGAYSALGAGYGASYGGLYGASPYGAGYGLGGLGGYGYGY